LLVAILSGCGAALIVRKGLTPPAAPPAETREVIREVLVLGRQVEAGEAVGPGDLRWLAWPGAHLPAGSINRMPGADAAAFQPALARFPLIEGEPLAEAKLIRPGQGSALAALTGAGRRAVAVPLREDSAAGGLIQPNDRVDVIWTPAQGDSLAERPPAKMLLRRVKVLAIGKSLQAGGRGEARTATLELTPAEVRTLAGARVSGEMTLAVVPFTDIVESTSEDGEQPQPAAGIRIMKFGR
jgi:pilus assembly protein CpaB